MVAAGTLIPKAALAQVPSSTCPPPPISATLCFAGSYTNTPIQEVTIGSAGAVANGWNIYSNADLDTPNGSYARLIDVSSGGGSGYSDSPGGGTAGTITVRNDGALTWTTPTTPSPFLITDLSVLYVQASGGQGYSPSNNDYGGLGGASASQGQGLSVSNNGAIQVSGLYFFGVAGMHVYAVGGNGGAGNQFTAGTNYYGGNGGNAGWISVANSGSITLGAAGHYQLNDNWAFGIDLRSQGGSGGLGSCSNADLSTCQNGLANHSGNGGSSNVVEIQNSGAIAVYWQPGSNSSNLMAGINAKSLGGNGGDSMSNYSSGGLGGNASTVQVYNTANITLSSTGAYTAQGAAIYALAQGGQGGVGQKQDSDSSDGIGGAGGSVQTTSVSVNHVARELSAYVSHGGSGVISTTGDHLIGILAAARGGNGGSGQDGWSASNSSGGVGGSAGTALVSLSGTAQVLTNGHYAAGVVAQSIGGVGGDGGNDGGLVGQSGGAGMGGAAGGGIVLTAAGTQIHTLGDYSAGIVAQSIGGGGGSGGDFTGVLGGQSGQGGRGGDACINPGSSGCATVFNTGIQAQGSVSTSGNFSYGLLAQSIGGAGGAGGITNGLVYSLGGDGGAGGNGSGVNVDSTGTIQTLGYGSLGMLVQSIGGGGGAAGVASGGISIGGDGATDYVANGGQVIVTQQGLVQTAGNAAIGILAQSIGGGGGSGGGTQGIISVGGTGSAGGAGDSVQVGVNGSIVTAGNYAFGVVAQSIGGGGGAGGDVLDWGFGIPTVGVGGSSAGGGAGGDVTIAFGGSVTTAGSHASGLVAQSIGGGGGSGGDVTGLLSFITVTIGGGATGGGGDGGTVTIDTSGTGARTVQTAGAYSVGVLAQSVGGGGGSGGNASSYNVGLNFAAGVAVGGDGGVGGNGGTVSVNWQGGSITTGATTRDMSTAPDLPIALIGQAANSYGLVAQSIGGGGGTGGSSQVDQFVASVPTELVTLPTVSLTSSVGGTGGNGGDGGNAGVSVSGASITTWAGGAHALVAQSIGGGGGTGGDASALSVAAAIPDTNDMPTLSIGVANGGTGAVGGNGQAVNVTVDQRSVLTTFGDNANAIVAQSIGGGGGDGGIGSAATYTLFEGTSIKTTIGLGAKGAGGGIGGDVDVTIGAGAAINTVGSGSRGVVAQSIGGGGGTSQGGTAGIAVGSFVGAVQVGRTGGSGDKGGTVNVTSAGVITTLAKDADGILAQSIGGGGGLGGTFGADGSWDNPNWINVIWDVQRVVKTLGDGSAGYSMTVTVGGSGGVGADGGAVNTNNTGLIRTTGDWADGIVAQSIGGGGGAGGTAVADGSQQTASVNVGVGGSGGAAGNGGTVTIQNVGLISTEGFGAYGLLAQSVGGGGGQGGDGSAKSTGKITVGGGVGGGGAVAGQGGMVQLLDTAADTFVSTKGALAHGIVLQSIGGGGGVGGAGSSTTPLVFQNQGFDIVVGGGPGAAGDGCAVTVGGATPNPNNCQATATGEGTTLRIRTEGLGAFGLVAQSIGGGGGIGGTADASSTTSVAIGGAAGASGNGNMVNLYLADSQIATSGLGAHAIVAQSIGGGGGIAGTASGTPLSFTNPDVSPSTGGAGNGGDVTVVTGTGARIGTTGDYAFGIVAQSIGGGGGLSNSAAGSFAGSNGGPNSVSGAVNVTLNGQLSATGNNSIGIFAQSAAIGGSGAITVDVNGTVVGGSGTQGTGVLVSGGNSSNAVNIGAQGSVSALSGTAISYNGLFAPTVTNDGSVQGSVLLRTDLGALGTLNNRGTLIAGSLLDADVTNSGRFSMVHAAGASTTTVISGNYTQSSIGYMIFGGDLTAGTSDRLQISGSAVLDGRLGFSFTSIRPNQSAVLLTADGGITGQLTADNGSGLFSFRLQQTGNAVSVSVAGANLASPSFNLNAHQTAVANGLQDIWNAGGGGLDTLFGALQNLAATGGYADALSKLAPGVALAPAARSRDGVQDFSNNLMSCPVFENDTALVGETQCTWARVGGKLTAQSGSGGVAGFNSSAMNYQFGAQVEIAPDWFLGGSLAYQQSWLSGTDGRVSSSGNGGAVGLALKHQVGAWLFAGSLGGSVGWYDTRRQIAIPGLAPTIAYANSNVLSGQARLRAAYSFVFEDWYVRPYADLDVIHVRTPGYSETGAGALGLTYDTAAQWTASFSPTLEVGGRKQLSERYTLRPYGSLGASFFSNSTWNSTARLQGGLGAGSFTTSMTTDPVVARLGAGVQMMASDGFDVRLTYDGAFSEHTVSNALSLRAAMRF